MVTVAAQANPAAAKSRIPSVLKSPLAIEVKPVMPTSLPATEYTGSAANVGCGSTCDEDKEAKQHARRHKPKKSPNLHYARPTRKHRNFPLKLLSDSENPPMWPCLQGQSRQTERGVDFIFSVEP